MNSDDGSKNQPQSLLSTSSPTTNSSGAGSTVTGPTSPNSNHSPANSKPNDATNPSSEPSRTVEDSVSEKGCIQAATEDKGQRSEAEGRGQQPPMESVKEEGETTLEPINVQIELLEHTPDAVVDDGHDWAPDGDHEMKRVKVYELIGARWVDQGTAFCFGQFQEETGAALLIARSERNYNDVILSTVIRSNDVYQRQQDTLIVWTEPDGVDYALSFQDPEGCSEVWNFICEVQQHMNAGEDPSGISSSPQLGPEPTSVTTATIIRTGHLPQPRLGIIGEIERAIKSLARTQTVKERICEYIQQEVSLPLSSSLGYMFLDPITFLPSTLLCILRRKRIDR